MVFKPKVDLWILIVVWGSIAAGVVAGAVSLVDGKMAIGLILIGSMAATGLLLRAIAWPVSFEVADGHFIVRAGMQTDRIPVKKITAAYRTRNPLSSVAAWSLDRTRVDYLKGSKNKDAYHLIAVQDRDGLFQALVAADPGLELADGKVTRP